MDSTRALERMETSQSSVAGVTEHKLQFLISVLHGHRGVGASLAPALESVACTSQR